MFERFFSQKESNPEGPSLEELERRNEEFGLRLKELVGKRDDMRRRMRLLEREQEELERGVKPDDGSRTWSDVLSEKGSVRLEMKKIQAEIDKVFEEIQRDDEALIKITRNEHPS